MFISYFFVLSLFLRLSFSLFSRFFLGSLLSIVREMSPFLSFVLSSFLSCCLFVDLPCFLSVSVCATLERRALFPAQCRKFHLRVNMSYPFLQLLQNKNQHSHTRGSQAPPPISSHAPFLVLLYFLSFFNFLFPVPPLAPSYPFPLKYLYISNSLPLSLSSTSLVSFLSSSGFPIPSSSVCT